MHVANTFFYSAVFFLLGVLLSSLGFSLVFSYLLIVLAAVILLVIFLFKRQKILLYFIPLLVFMFLGAIYFRWDHERFLDVNLPAGKGEWAGIVVDELPSSSLRRRLVLELQPPYRGRVLLETPPYPNFSYGDLLSVVGDVKFIEKSGYGFYLMKERVTGTVNYPKIAYVSSGHGDFLKDRLIGFRRKVVNVFNSILPQKEAAFLAGITLGERGDFSREFKEAMSKSGTTHLIALSGYNITVIAWAITGLFFVAFSRRVSFIVTILAILGFVVMTGAEASVVRAAIMGTIVLFAEEIGRRRDFRNAIVLSALLMTLHNPKVLLFDIGFELSFLAVIGIVYLKPALKKMLGLEEQKSGILPWRENLLTTFSAQAMTAPLLISEFGNFSPVSLFSNLVILELIPLTMSFGFAAAFISFVSSWLAQAVAWFTYPLLWFETRAIELFGTISPPFNTELSPLFVLVYYGAAAYIIFYAYRQNHKTNK